MGPGEADLTSWMVDQGPTAHVHKALTLASAGAFPGGKGDEGCVSGRISASLPLTVIVNDNHSLLLVILSKVNRPDEVYGWFATL